VASKTRIIEEAPTLTEEELDQCASEADLAQAERLLAIILVRSWQHSRKKQAKHGVTTESDST